MNVQEMIPIGKYVNDCGSEGIRYVWRLDQKQAPFVESGAFTRRTKIGGSDDDKIAAYTTSVSLGCVLAGEMAVPCAFCVTGNVIGYRRPLTPQQIVLQNVFMALDDDHANQNGQSREFAYMGQGEPGLAYPVVRSAIQGTDRVMGALKIPVYRHIFATSGVPHAIRQLGSDIAAGQYLSDILLHLSIHSVTQRDDIMPLNRKYPLTEVIAAANEYSVLTGKMAVVNFMMFKNARVSGKGPINTATVEEMEALIQLLNPQNQRVVLCEYNPDPRIGVNEDLIPEDIVPLEEMLSRAGFQHKKFIAFGRRNNLACGLLGGSAEPNLEYKAVEETLEQSVKLITQHM